MQPATLVSTIAVVATRLPTTPTSTTPAYDPFPLMQAGLTAVRLQQLLDEALAEVSDLTKADLPSDLRRVVRHLGDGLHALLVASDELNARVVHHERATPRRH